jgi:hypothetical protein
MLFNAVATTILKWHTFKLLRREQLLKRFVDSDEIWYGGKDIKGDLDHYKMAFCLSPANNS